MNSTISAIVIALMGIGGTLASALLTQQSANNNKRQELDRSEQQRREEREYHARQEAMDARRACYVGLNTAARLFLTELTNYLHALSAGESLDAVHSQVEDVRREHRARHAEAQMIVPDDVLAAASAVNIQLGNLYGILKRCEQGDPTLGEMSKETEGMRARTWDLLAEMRALMREDLGIASQGNSMDH
ncbi:hypothetical protein GCM10009527_063610 [Actinomadura nitritigenes]|uniref:Uncharacterized protein n=1 Tax=Actinomadura nitritigenes TaxID=134602 RepID=A0ABS3RE49_9ACTN|nr:hypothetical protein [Actinomadura nitritigenes]MBO2443874.1 hypothetical protein [Actinomadura nitritigenes]